MCNTWKACCIIMWPYTVSYQQFSIARRWSYSTEFCFYHSIIWRIFDTIQWRQQLRTSLCVCAMVPAFNNYVGLVSTSHLYTAWDLAQGKSRIIFDGDGLIGDHSLDGFSCDVIIFQNKINQSFWGFSFIRFKLDRVSYRPYA